MPSNRVFTSAKIVPAAAAASRADALKTLSMIVLGLVALPAATRAQEPPATVTVTAKKEAVVKKLDKTVYDASNMPRAANGTAQDVLQSTPGLSVTVDGQISVKGNGQVTVLVDGKPTAMLSGDGRAVALQTMSGADIASIEVITNPSAAYANGGAILNIVLKRNRKPGAHRQVQASAADQGLWNVSTSGDVTRKAMSVHGSLALRHDGTFKVRRSAVGWHNRLDGQTGQTLQASEVFVRRIVQSAALGVDYTLSDTDSLSLSTRYNRRRSRPLFDVLNEERTGAAQSIFHRISLGPNEQSDGSASLSYSRQDSGAALKATLQRSDTHGLIDKSYRDVFVQPVRATAYSHGATRSARHLSEASIDWSRPSEHGQWGLGVDIQRQGDDIDNYQGAVDPATGAETPAADTTNGYAVSTTLSAAYLTDQIKRGQWEVLLGARAERMALRVSPAQGSVQNSAQTSHWQAFNPSLNLKYAVSDSTGLTLGYRRSLQRPDSRDLNPFSTYVDAQNISRGNPRLKPQLLTSWEAGADAALEHLSGSVGAFYRASSDTVTDARSFADQVLVTSKQNGGRARSAGVTGAVNWKRDAKLQVGLDGGAYRVMLQTPDLPGLVRQDRISTYINVTATYNAGPDEVSLDAHGQSAGITPLGRYGATSSVNLSWKHRLTKTLSMTVNASDIFDGSKRTYQTESSTFRQSGFDHFVARRLYVGLVQKTE